MKKRMISNLINLGLFLIAYFAFGWLFAAGSSPEDTRILTAIGNATGALIYIIVDQCSKLKKDEK
jgi:hypothetical protein